MNSKSRLYRIHQGMKQRCYNTKNPGYIRYGGRGIIVCDEWREDFAAFREWAMASGYTDELTIDRIDNDGNYEPSNCRWISLAENSKRATKKNCEGHLLSKLRRYREEKGLTQKQLAELSGIAQADISKTERGNLNITYRTLHRLASALGLQVRISFVPNDDDLE